MEFTAEVFDQVQRLFDLNGFNDHQLHCVLRFEAGRGPDPEILRKAVIASIEAIPILGTRYVADGKPRWVSLDRSDLDRAFMTARTEPELEAALVARADEERGPQIRLCLLDSDPAAIALTINHMITDGAGCKAYLYFLCATYAGLAADPNFKPTPIAGDRGIGRVLDRLGFGAKLVSLVAQRGDNNRSGDRCFPFSKGGTTRPFIVTLKLDRQRTAALRDYGHAQGATLNDLLLASLYRCLFEKLALSPGAELTVPVMVDMRRYLDAGEASTALTNLSSMVATRLDYRPGEGFADTLRRVKAAMDEKKSGDIGLNSFVKLALLFRLRGDRIANRVLRSRLRNPFIAMTNIGVLDEARLVFGDRRPSDAYVFGSIKYRPYFQLAVSSYQDELTLTINLDGTPADREAVVSVLDALDGELQNAAQVLHLPEPARA